MNETDLCVALDRYDAIVDACAAGRISFAQFLEQYDNFYTTYGLDGHHSSDKERELLIHFERRIALHREIWEQVLSRVCADDEAKNPDFTAAGFFGSSEATIRLRHLALVYLPERTEG
jgi:hypothetical protein